MNTKHTPGPWSQSHRKSGNGYSTTEVYCAAGQTIATLAWYPVPTPTGTTTSREANARLIAAAPDLLAALQDLFGAELEKCMAFDGHDDQMEAVERARAAIAKATGEAP